MLRGRPPGSMSKTKKAQLERFAAEAAERKENPVLRKKLRKAEAVATSMLDEDSRQKLDKRLHKSAVAEERGKNPRSGGGNNNLRNRPEFREMSDEEYAIARAERLQVQRSLSAKRRHERKKELANGAVLPDLRLAQGKVENPAEDGQILPYKELPFQDRKQMKAAMIASLYLGQSAAQISVQYNIPMNQVESVKRAFEAMQSVRNRDWLSETLMTYIQQEIKSLMAISMVTSTEEWVMGQNAGDLAMYIATKSDRLTQLLQSFGRVTEEHDQYVEQLDAIVQRS